MPHHFRSGPAFAYRRIGLLGGSFNPAHRAHLEASLHALKRLGLHQIWWLVSPQNPLKSRFEMAPLLQRLAGARRMARHPRIIVTALEDESGTRYTADVLRLLKQRFPRTRFVWLMGADNLAQLPHWHDWQSIFRSVPVAVFRRPLYAAGRKKGKAAQRFDHAWKPPARAKKLALMKAPAWLLFDNRLDATSSTRIREEMRRGESKT